MRKILAMAAATLAAVSAIGCQEQAKPKSASPSVLDVQPARKLTPTYALTPQQVTPPDEPRAAVDTAPLRTVTPTDAGRSVPASAHPAKPAKARQHRPAGQFLQGQERGHPLPHRQDRIWRREQVDGHRIGQPWHLAAIAEGGANAADPVRTGGAGS